MSKITKKDIESFGKVLVHIGGELQRNPDSLMKILSSMDSIGGEKIPPEISEKVKSINIFDLYKDKDKSYIIDDLEQYTKDELKFIINKFKLGPCRATSVKGLADFIGSLLIKRTQDVFINQK